MLDLSPTKLLIIFVVVVVLLGPKRLPEVARQLGAGWRKLRELHLQVDRELRQSLPDLPSSQEIVRFARSPVALLNQLADRHDELSARDRLDGRVGLGGNGELDGEAEGLAALGGATISAEAPSAIGVPALAGLDTDDPNLN